MCIIMDKPKIIADVVRSMNRWYADQPEPKGAIGKLCVFWAGMTASRLQHLGIKASINAGTAYWKVKEDDTGEGFYQFGYEFNWTRRAFLEIATGNLPEMHAWCVIPPEHCPEGRGQLIDPTTRFLNQNAHDNGVAADLVQPDYLWFYLDAIPPDVRYKVSAQACHIAYAVLERMSKPGAPLAVPVVEPFVG